MEMTVEAAIIITARKHGYNKEQVAKMRQEVEKGNFKVITKDYGAREFVKKYYEKRQEMLGTNQKEIKPIDLYDLNDFFNSTLETLGLNKEDPRCLKALEKTILLVSNNHRQRVIGSHLMNKQILDDLMIYAACEYSKKTEKDIQSKRLYNFKTDDITRKEACDITRAYIAQDKNDNIYTALNSFSNYKTQMLNNLINYVYYENDFSKKQDNSELNKAM